MELLGKSDPAGSDGYVPGAWDEVRSALLDGHISEEAFDVMKDHILATPIGEPWRHTLEYAATALEASSDNGDQYCAAQIRGRLAASKDLGVEV